MNPSERSEHTIIKATRCICTLSLDQSLEILENHRKGYGPDLVRQSFAMAEAEGLRTAATFILGLPEETAETLQATIDFACSLPADYASFNVAVPRAGTMLTPW